MVLHSRAAAAGRIQRVVRGHLGRTRLIHQHRTRLYQQLRRWAQGRTEKLLENSQLQDDASQRVVDAAIALATAAVPPPGSALTVLKVLAFYARTCRDKQEELSAYFAQVRAVYRQRQQDRRAMATEDRASLFREKYQRFLDATWAEKEEEVQDEKDATADEEQRLHERMLRYRARVEVEMEEARCRGEREDMFREDMRLQEARRAELARLRAAALVDVELMRQEDLLSRRLEDTYLEEQRRRLVVADEETKVVRARDGVPIRRPPPAWFTGTPSPPRVKFSAPMRLGSLSGAADGQGGGDGGDGDAPTRLVVAEAALFSEIALKDSCRLLAVLRAIRLERKAWHRRLLGHVAEFDRTHAALRRNRDDFTRKKFASRADKKEHQRAATGHEEALLKLRASMILCGRFLIELLRREVVLVGEVFDSSAEPVSPFPAPYPASTTAPLAPATSGHLASESSLASSWVVPSSAHLGQPVAVAVTGGEDLFPAPSGAEGRPSPQKDDDASVDEGSLQTDVQSMESATRGGPLPLPPRATAVVASPSPSRQRNSLFSGSASRASSRKGSTAAEWTKVDKVYITSLRDFYCVMAAAAAAATVPATTGQHHHRSPHYEYAKKRAVLAEKAVQNVGSLRRTSTTAYFPDAPPPERCTDYGKRRKKAKPPQKNAMPESTESSVHRGSGNGNGSTRPPSVASALASKAATSRSHTGTPRSASHGNNNNNNNNNRREGDSDADSVDSRRSLSSAGSQASLGSLTASVTSTDNKRRGKKHRRDNTANKKKRGGAQKKPSSQGASPQKKPPKTMRERMEARDDFDIAGQTYFMEADIDEYDFIDWTKEVCDWAQDCVLAWINDKEGAWRRRNRGQCISYLQRLHSLAAYNDDDASDSVGGRSVAVVSAEDTSVPRCVDGADALDLHELLLCRAGVLLKAYVPLPPVPFAFRAAAYRAELPPALCDALLARHPASILQLLCVGSCSLASVALEFSLTPMPKDDAARLLDAERALVRSGPLVLLPAADNAAPDWDANSLSSQGSGSAAGLASPPPQHSESRAQKRGSTATAASTEPPVAVTVTVSREQLLSSAPSTLCFGTDTAQVHKAVRQELAQLEALARTLLGEGVMVEAAATPATLVRPSHEPTRLVVRPDLDLTLFVRTTTSTKIADCVVPRWMQPVHRWSRWVVEERKVQRRGTNVAVARKQSNALLRLSISQLEGEGVDVGRARQHTSRTNTHRSGGSVVVVASGHHGSTARHSLSHPGSVGGLHTARSAEEGEEEDVDEFDDEGYEFAEDDAEVLDRKVDFQAKRFAVNLRLQTLRRKARRQMLDECFRRSLETDLMAREDAVVKARKADEVRRRRAQERQKQQQQQQQQQQQAGAWWCCGGSADAVVVPTDRDPPPVSLGPSIPQTVPTEVLHRAAGGDAAAYATLLSTNRISKDVQALLKEETFPVAVSATTTVPLKDLKALLRRSILPRERLASWVDDDTDFHDTAVMSHASAAQGGDGGEFVADGSLSQRRAGSFASVRSSISLLPASAAAMSLALRGSFSVASGGPHFPPTGRLSREPSLTMRSREPSIAMQALEGLDDDSMSLITPGASFVLLLPPPHITPRGSFLSVPVHGPSGTSSLTAAQAASSIGGVQLRSRLEEVVVCGGTSKGGTVVVLVAKTLGKTDHGVDGDKPLRVLALNEKQLLREYVPPGPSASVSTTDDGAAAVARSIMQGIFSARVGFADRPLCATVRKCFADCIALTPRPLPLCKHAAALAVAQSRQRAGVVGLGMVRNGSSSTLETFNHPHAATNLPQLRDLELFFVASIS